MSSATQLSDILANYPSSNSKKPKTEGRRNISLKLLVVHLLTAQSNLLVARLQRTKPFSAEAPVLYEFAPLLAEAKDWLCNIEQSIDEIEDSDLLSALDNYDHLHRIVRHTTGTDLLRYAYRRILVNAIGKSPADIDSYVVDAYFRISDNEDLPSVKLKQVAFLATEAPATKAPAHIDEGDNFPYNVLRYWATTLSNPLSPLPSRPELISRLRLLLQYHSSSETLLSYSLNLLRYSLTETASSSVYHSLLTFVIRLKPILSQHIDVERTIRRLQKRLSEAPDNHPLDRAARRQVLDNARAFAKSQLTTAYRE